MIKKILAFLKTIKFKSSCCYESQCSMNAREEDTNDSRQTRQLKNLDKIYNEISEDFEIEEADLDQNSDEDLEENIEHNAADNLVRS